MTTMYFSSYRLWALALLVGLALSLIPGAALCADDEDTVGFYSNWQDEASSASRSPKPLSQTAENVTVLTSAEIEALNAHSLADVLDTIPGIQVSHNGGPGVSAYTNIQSIAFNFTQVFIDGVSITSLGSGFSDVSQIPAGIIDRIEIVKGAASAAWGQALGGVINVITKQPAPRQLAGNATASLGSRTTTDDRLELSGSSGQAGYYLSGGFLGSDGLRSNGQTAINNVFAKLTYDLPGQGHLWGTFFSNRADFGDLYAPSLGYKESAAVHNLLGSVGVSYPLTERLELEMSAHHFYRRDDESYFNLGNDGSWSPQPGLPTDTGKELQSGGSVKLTRRDENNILVAGCDYLHVEVYNNSVDTYTYSPYSQRADRWGLFLNDTVIQGALAVTPGVRLDHTQTNGAQFSPALGMTWQATDSTLLRAYTARGYGLSDLLANITPAVKIWTSQVGVESKAVPGIWLKGTLFRNQTWNDSVGVGQQLALGSELEARSTPLYHTSLSAGYTFTGTTQAGNEVNGAPRHTVQLGLWYDDGTLRGVLTGRHIFWNSYPSDDGSYGGLIWDLHLGYTIYRHQDRSLELFFSGRNLFNGAQYESLLNPNTPRWYEGGIKVGF